MELGQLIQGLAIRAAGAPLGVRIVQITDDSRTAGPGSLFVARSGHHADGRRFIRDALNRGAVAVLAAADASGELPAGVPLLSCEDPAGSAMALALRLHGDPPPRLRLIGITGTNGKTTTAYMIRHLLAAAGRRCGLIGTVEIDDGQTRKAATLTTPGALELIALLGRMVEHGCDACVMEVSSHALDQGRVAALDFSVALFSNLTGDHLDYHKTMEAYAAAKAKLFASLGPAAVAGVNADDAAAERMVAGSRARVMRFGFEAAGKKLDIAARVHHATAHGADTTFTGPWGEVRVMLPLIGAHNVANMLAALTAVHAAGADVGKLRDAVEHCPQVPGRLERVNVPGVNPPFVTLVDYAHTDDALSNVLGALRPLTTGKLRVLFGCGGDRDPTKRPRMARVAVEMADAVVVTSDNPRTEDPAEIIRQVLGGVKDSERDRVMVEPDRAAAIDAVIRAAGPGDVVLLAGKGHEDYQIIGTQKRPFDDRLVAAASMKSRYAAEQPQRRPDAEEADAVTPLNFWTPENLQAITGGRWIHRPASLGPIKGLSTDSRSIAPGQVFVALRGENFDGHGYLAAAVERGSPLLVIDRPDSAANLPTDRAAVLAVPDTLRALAQLAAAFRRQFRGKVIAITGSVGKTTTKQLVHAVLSEALKGSASLKSFNNHVGVPLTILAADPGDDYMVVEVGTNAPGEIADLSGIVQPDVAVITQIGNAHLQGLGGLDGVLAEKTSMLRFVRPGGLAVLCGDSYRLNEFRGVAAKTITYGKQSGADLQLTACRTDSEGSTIEVNGRWTYRLPLLGEHNALNALAAVAVAQHLGLSPRVIAGGLVAAKPPAQRLNIRRIGPAENPLVLIDDSYNANPDSMASALAVLGGYPASGRRVAVLGDMLEMGEAGPEMHRRLGDRVAESGIDAAMFVGELTLFAAQAVARRWEPERVHALGAWTAETAGQIAAALRPGDVVLLKGSRGMKLERVIPEIEKRWADGERLIINH